MPKINLEAKTSNEKIILTYLTESASEDLAERINAGSKTLAQCWNYIVSEAKKLAKNGCACVEDSTVYGWAIHFFEEDDIKGTSYNKAASGSVVTAKEKPSKTTKVEEPVNVSKKKKEKPQGLDQISFADLFG